MTLEHLEKINNCRFLLPEPAPAVVKELIDEIKRLNAENKIIIDALIKIEDIFVDGEDTHDDWLSMGKIAQNALKTVDEKGKAI